MASSDRSRHWLSERRLSRWLPLSAGFVGLACVASASVWLVVANSRYQALVVHTQEVQAQAYRLLTLMQGLDTGQRGYLITGDDVFLRPYDEGMREAHPVMLGLKALTADNPVQQREIAGLQPLLEAKQAAVSEIVETRRRRDLDAAFALVRTGRNNELSERTKQSVERLLAEEARLLTDRTAIAATNSRWLLMATLAAPLLVILLAIATLIAVRRRELALVAAEASLRNANENLERVVKIRTAGLREANEEIKRFAYIVSHDLRAPLVNIMGFTSELEAVRTEMVRGVCPSTPSGSSGLDRAQDLDAEFGEALGFIKASTARMDRLIGAILKLSRQGYRVLTPERLDMQALMTQIAASLQAQCLERGVQIEISPTLPTLHADRLALEQVFTNLIENAIKYLDDNRPGRVEIRGFIEPGQDGATVFEIQDSGRGIAPEDRERVFDLFRRAGPQDRPGEGIGLAHVRTLLRAMEGSVKCSSTLGVGTTFRITLPQKSTTA
jgi:signal transduction histidine kinase